MKILNSVWLYADDIGGSNRGSTYTLNIGRLDVFAQITLSTFVPAENSDSRGTGAGARILRYTSYKPIFGGVDIIAPTFLPEDFKFNSIFIPQCASITFGLIVKNSFAYASGIVFV